MQSSRRFCRKKTHIVLATRKTRRRGLDLDQNLIVENLSQCYFESDSIVLEAFQDSYEQCPIFQQCQQVLQVEYCTRSDSGCGSSSDTANHGLRSTRRGQIEVVETIFSRVQTEGGCT